MQFTTLLDQNQGASVSWPTAPPLAEESTAVAVGTPCQEHTDADLWFAERSADVELAKAMCQECPLRRACLQGALERREPWGVWGGEILIDGAVVARKRGRGRPRKNAAA